MIGFRVTNETLLEQVVPLAAPHTQRWREGFWLIVSAFNMTIGRELSLAYDLPHAVIANNSQSQRIAWGEGYLLEADQEQFAGYLFGWLLLHREDFMQVLWGQVERQQASYELRARMYTFLQNGKLD